MKKIILIILSCILVMSFFIIGVSAINETNYTRTFQFDQTKKAYPIMNSVSDAIGFFEYYGGNSIHLSLYADKENSMGELAFNVMCENVTITYSSVEGYYPNWSYVVENPMIYTDFSVLHLNDSYYLYGLTEGEYVELCNFSENGEIFGGFEQYTTLGVSDDYYVEFPENDLPEEVVKPLPIELINITVVSLGGFVSGLGTVFNNAFTSLFIANGVFNSLAIFLLVICGIGLGYGVIRWITGLFNKKGE